MTKLFTKTLLLAIFLVSTTSLSVYAFIPGNNLAGGSSEDSSFIEDLYVLIDVNYFANYDHPDATAKANMSDKVFVGTEKKPRGSGKQILIKLTEGGVPILDPSFNGDFSYHDVPGIHLVRGVDGYGRSYVDFVTYGFLGSTESRESVKFTAWFLGPTVTSSILKLDHHNGEPGTGRYENYENGICGIKRNSKRNAEFDNPVEDQFKFIGSRYISKVKFCSITANKLDRMRVFYERKL